MSMENSKQQARRRQQDEALNKLLIWFGVAIGYEAVVLLIRRFFINFRASEAGVFDFLTGAFLVLQWAAPVLTAAALVWLVLCWRRKAALRAPAICAAAMFALWMTALLACRYGSSGVDLLGAAAPAAAILALVYYLYQRDFFCNTIFSAGGILSLWLYRRYYQDHPNAILAGFILGWVLLAAAAFLAWKLSESKGKWKGRQLFPPKTSWTPTYMTCAIAALTMAAAMIGGATVAFYAIFVLVVWLFCMAVYYTVRMM